jgi:hypothetical protein
MSIRQRLSSTEDGRPVVIKQATGAADVERLVREAAVLRAAAHPGVVEVLADRPLPGDVHELMLNVAGTRTAGDLHLPLAGAAGLVASLASTVADLHDLGIVHGRVRADHVVIDAGGRPVLCGFGEALRFDDGDVPMVARAAEVAALGELLRRLVEAHDEGADGWVPIPERRFRGADRWAVHARRALLNVADHATADDPAARPDARALAASVLAALPEARITGAAGGTDDAALPPTSVPWPRRSFERLRRSGAAVRGLRLRPGHLTRVAAVVGLGLLVLGVGGLLRPGDGTSGAPAGAGPASAPAPDRAARRATSTETTAPPPTAAAPGCPAPSAPAPGTVLADHDGDGCPSPVVLGDGAVELAGTRYLVGAPGDLLAVGDWDCDGRATVGLVERPSGLVYLFERWAREGADEVVPAVAAVEGAESVATAPGDDGGCEVLVVTDADGRRTEVEA